ncbi:hypothetical protein CDCA_CDCA03G1053 [Cyanidium caldarium]|uniref:Mediator of RNA polymerase II transcription subunit 4 n=1 Tax=Cyanidium caldarium TaxID=2771 RepID=A0AAV9ISI2_CYACA|nr:hypothetical protein CDCA_CDCA03G1053 [Cyanidium caldarium]
MGTPVEAHSIHGNGGVEYGLSARDAARECLIECAALVGRLVELAGRLVREPARRADTAPADQTGQQLLGVAEQLAQQQGVLEGAVQRLVAHWRTVSRVAALRRAVAAEDAQIARLREALYQVDDVLTEKGVDEMDSAVRSGRQVSVSGALRLAERFPRIGGNEPPYPPF